MLTSQGERMPDPVPSQIIAGKYELERELARGGMGSVWIARDLGLGRRVALKLILADGAEKAGTRERFVREARSLGALSSRHIVPVFDFGVEGESPFLVMELLHGEDLGARLKARGRLTLAEVEILATQIGKALTVAHDRGVIHRDLKPQNIFLAHIDDEEVAKVLDFGIAKLVDAGPKPHDLTRTGAVVGTPQYMSPEQFRSPKSVDHRSDLWALGALLYRALTGKLAFSGDSLGEIVMAIATESPEPPSALCPEAPPEIDAFFERAFQKKPAARFQSAKELSDAFADIARTQPRPGPVSVPKPVAAPAPIKMPPTPTEADTVHLGTREPPPAVRGSEVSLPPQRTLISPTEKPPAPVPAPPSARPGGLPGALSSDIRSGIAKKG